MIVSTSVILRSSALKSSAPYFDLDSSQNPKSEAEKDINEKTILGMLGARRGHICTFQGGRHVV